MNIVAWIIALVFLFVSFFLVSVGIHVIFGITFTYTSIALTVVSTMLVALFITIFGRGDHE